MLVKHSEFSKPVKSWFITYWWGSGVSLLVVTVNLVVIGAARWRPETFEMDVFTLQLITMSDAASLDV